MSFQEQSASSGHLITSSQGNCKSLSRFRMAKSEIGVVESTFGFFTKNVEMLGLKSSLGKSSINYKPINVLCYSIVVISRSVLFQKMELQFSRSLSRERKQGRLPKGMRNPPRCRRASKLLGSRFHLCAVLFVCSQLFRGSGRALSVLLRRLRETEQTAGRSFGTHNSNM